MLAITLALVVVISLVIGLTTAFLRGVLDPIVPCMLLAVPQQRIDTGSPCVGDNVNGFGAMCILCTYSFYRDVVCAPSAPQTRVARRGHCSCRLALSVLSCGCVGGNSGARKFLHALTRTGGLYSLRRYSYQSFSLRLFGWRSDLATGSLSWSLLPVHCQRRSFHLSRH